MAKTQKDSGSITASGRFVVQNCGVHIEGSDGAPHHYHYRGRQIGPQGANSDTSSVVKAY